MKQHISTIKATHSVWIVNAKDCQGNPRTGKVDYIAHLKLVKLRLRSK